MSLYGYYIQEAYNGLDKKGFKIDKSGHYVRIQSKYKIKSINISISSFIKSDTEKSDDEILEDVLSKIDIEKFNKECKIFTRSFSSIESEIFKRLDKMADDWSDDEESFSVIKKYLHLDYIEYNNFKDKPTKFEIWYNAKDHGDRSKAFGGHSIVSEVNIKDNKAILSDHSPNLEG